MPAIFIFAVFATPMFWATSRPARSQVNSAIRDQCISGIWRPFETRAPTPRVTSPTAAPRSPSTLARVL